jgi:rhodanese-related sulfurtransferase
MTTFSTLAVASVLLAIGAAACGGESATAGAASAVDPKTAEAAQGDLKRLTAEEVETRLGSGEKAFYVFDANGEDRFKKGHVPGAKHVPADAVSADKLPADKAATLVFYCGSEKCGASHVAAKAAMGLGYTNVFIMPEGIAGWEKKGKKTES